MRLSWLRLALAGALVAALGLAWLVWSGTGGRLVHRELEAELARRSGRAVALEAISFRLERGLRLSLRNVRVFPTPARTGEPLLRAGRVLVWLDIPSLLIGRLMLGGVMLEGASLRVLRAEDGSFPELRLPAPSATTGAGARADADDVFGEGLARAIESLEPLAQQASDRMRFASRVALHDGTLAFVDRMRGEDPPPIRLELVELEASRNRLSDAGSLELAAVVVDGRHAPFPIRFSVRRDEDRPFAWDLGWQGVSLAAARTLVPSLPVLAGLAGRWSGSLSVRRDASGVNLLSFGSRVEQAELVLPRSQQHMAWDALDLAARVELAADQVRVRDGHVGGRRIRSDFELTVERPLRPVSRAKLETRLVGVEFGDLHTVADALRKEFVTARSLARLVDQVASGRIERLEASGSAPLLQWQALWRGPERSLPEDFLLSGAFSEVEVEGAASDSVRAVSGEVDWIGDKLVLRGARARYRDAWLPRLDLSIEGLSHFARVTRKAERVRASPPVLPGLAPLAKILRPRDPTALPPVKAIGLAIDRLEHPVLRWPLTAARVLVEPVRRGVQIQLREGLLGGTPVAGEIVFAGEPEGSGEGGRVQADLVFSRASPPDATSGTGSDARAGAHAEAASRRGAASQSAWPAERWGAGEVELEFRPRPSLPFAHATGYFRLDGSDFVARDVEIDLAPQGTIETRGVVGLEDPDTIGLELSFALTGGRFEEHGPFFALPARLIRGGMQVTGSLAGRVRPDTVFVAELDGQMQAEAREGRVALAVPLLLRLSKATEGYNPFADEDEIGFEKMSATIDLRHGLLESQDFVLEGPLRAYAKARIDTNRRPVDIDSVVGIFLFRAPNQILKNVPILNAILPGSERGLIGAYFRVEGAIGAPDVEALPLATFLTAVPNAIKAPMRALQYLFDRGGRADRLPAPDGRSR